jgi:hypothetical protein
MENDVSSGSSSPRNPAIGEAARTLGRASAEAIRGTPAAKKRASKAGKYSWSTRLKNTFEAGYEFGLKHEVPVEEAWKIWVVTKHGGLARLFGWTGWLIVGVLLIEELYDFWQ